MLEKNDESIGEAENDFGTQIGSGAIVDQDLLLDSELGGAGNTVFAKQDNSSSVGSIETSKFESFVDEDEDDDGNLYKLIYLFVAIVLCIVCAFTSSHIYRTVIQKEKARRLQRDRTRNQTHEMTAQDLASRHSRA